MDAQSTTTVGKYSYILFAHDKAPFTHRVEVRLATPKAKYAPYKIKHNYGFRSLEQAQAYIKTNVEHMEQSAIQAAAKKAEAAAEKAAVKAEDFFKVGDILYNSWGYEQTNIEFYRVVAVKAKTIEIQELSMQTVPDSEGMDCDKVIAGSKLLPNGRRYSLRVKPNGYLSAPERFYHFSKWDGRALYRSWYY